MGLSNNQNKGITYLKIKEGKFYKTDDKEHGSPYDEIGGQIVNFSYKDETFSNQEVRKFQILITDGEDKYLLSFPIESPAYNSFLSFVKNVDITKPLSLHALGKKIEDKSGKESIRTSILISQDGTFAKSFYTKDNPNGLPAFKKVKISGKEHWDKTDYLAFLESVVENELKPQLPSAKNENKLVFKEHTPVTTQETVDLDDLPF
jgi:hypothetical protein